MAVLCTHLYEDMVWLIHAIAQATKHAQHEQQAYVQLVPAVIIECVKYH